MVYVFCICSLPPSAPPLSFKFSLTFRDRVSYSSGWPWTHCSTKLSFESNSPASISQVLRLHVCPTNLSFFPTTVFLFMLLCGAEACLFSSRGHWMSIPQLTSLVLMDTGGVSSLVLVYCCRGLSLCLGECTSPFLCLCPWEWNS